MKTKGWILGGLLLLCPAARGESVDLLRTYPTQLTTGDANPDRARPWEFTAADVFRVSKFELTVVEELKIEIGPADLGIGHCADGAVWAIVIPRDKGTLNGEAAKQEESIAHVWLRFHPKEISRLFPPDTVFSDGATNLAAQMRAIAQTKFTSSWHAGMNAMIPEPKDLTVDVDTKDGVRRFFGVDTEARTAKYVSAFEQRSVKPPPVFNAESAAKAFDQLWEAFDRDYAMFVLRPDVNWAKLREQYRPKVLASKSTHEFAEVCAELLRPLRDLHVWLTVAGANVPVFDRPRLANSNPTAHRAILGGDLKQSGRLQWAVTSEKIGFIAISSWSTGPEIPALVDEALEQMRDTRGLIVDVRLNGGGDEPTAGKVAGRFLEKQFVYSYSQFRNGSKHTDLTQKFERKIGPRGPWRYNRPVVLLIGQKCMSSNESFIAMMSGATNVTILGDHTCGSSGNPRIVKLPLDMTVSVPRWIDILPDGKPLDERGFQPQVQFQPKPGAFEGERDDLLTAALERLRKEPLPEKTIEGPAVVLEPTREAEVHPGRIDGLSALLAAAKEETEDASRPKVISLTPAEGAEAVAAVTELRIRFDRPMEPLSLKLDWETGGFLDCEFPKYDPERYEFTLPIRLAPGSLHQIVVNKPFIWMPGAPGLQLSQTRRQFPRDGFQSTEHRQAALTVWQFRTQGEGKPVKGAPPKVVSISPTPGSAVALLSFVEIRFDRPMAPPTETIPCVAAVMGAKTPGAICNAEYNPTNYSFRIPLLSPLKDQIRFRLLGHNIEVPRMLTPMGKVNFSLTGFRSASGVAAAPVQIEYAVAETEFANADRKKIEAAAKDPRLLAILDSLKQKRAQLASVAERVQNLDLGLRSNVFASLKSESANFKWQQPNLFYGDVSEVMLSCTAFRIGSDGREWWFHVASDNTTTFQVCPVAEMHRANTSFCDPFGLIRISPAQAAGDLGLNYVGPAELGNKTCDVFEAWSVESLGSVTTWGELTRWWIDPNTALPQQMEQFRDLGVSRTRFLYDAVNEPLPTADFAVPRIEGMSPSPPEALDEDYTNRFVIIRDGSNGRMSVRWGKKGPKGTSSGGLN